MDMNRSALFLLLLWFSLDSAIAQDFTIKNFDVSIQIDRSGVINTHEKITVDFSAQKRGIIRNIPYQYTYQKKSYKANITSIVVKDQPSKITDQSGQKSIRIGDPDRYITGRQVYDITYKVKGPFITADTYDEFYWNITGNEWTAPIEKVNFDITLPDDIALDYADLKLYAGKTGSRADSGFIQQEGRHITGQNINILQPGEGLTIALKLPSGYIDPVNTVHLSESRTQEVMRKLKTQWPLAILPAILISLMVGWWNKMKTRFNPEPITEPQPYPPLDMNPAEVGAFFDHIVNDRDVISLLPYWAAQGFIKMEYDQRSEDTYLIKLQNLDEKHAAYEYTLFNKIFEGRPSVSLSSLRNNFHQTHAAVKSMIKQEIIDKELYDPEYRHWFKSWRSWIGITAFMVLAILCMALGYWLAGIFFIIGFIIGIILITTSQVLSQRGQLMHQKLKAFYAFLKGDQNQSLESVIKDDPNYFDKVYPYAVALKLDKSFITKVRPYIPQAPIWYGYYGMGMGQHHQTMNDFGTHFEPKEISSAFTSYPQPTVGSGGGSFGGGGGGFSGGGFGGGGGSSW